MAAASEEGVTRVDLGFVEETLSWKLSSKYFCSKIGGKPAWLNLADLPSPSQLKCPTCQKQLVFLLQVYAPDENLDACFHRTVYLFTCRNPTCSKNNSNKTFSVFRCQLKRYNTFYSSEPAKENENDIHPVAEDFVKTCVICGCNGPLRCARCKKVNYCSPDHQLIDWKAGHKRVCSQSSEEAYLTSKGSEKVLLPEFELVTEAEPSITEASEEKTEEAALAEYEKFVETNNVQSKLKGEVSEKDLEALAAKEDVQFTKFAERIKLDPEQVLRYEKNGEPLWVSSEHKPNAGDIPPCSCGASRQFEFQVLPQLLNHLKLDSLNESVDWGTLAIYTCSKNCDDGPAYHPEFVWKQDFSSDAAPNTLSAEDDL